MFDFNNPSVQSMLPQHLTASAYMQAGGTAGGYNPWVENNINKTLNQSAYSTYDPRYFQGQETFGNAQGIHPLDRNVDQGDMFNFQDPELFRQRAMGQPVSSPANTTTDKPGATTPGNTPGNTNAATPGASAALGRGLKNRRPGLAGGFNGWSGGIQDGSSSNFNYFSRFA